MYSRLKLNFCKQVALRAKPDQFPTCKSGGGNALSECSAGGLQFAKNGEAMFGAVRNLLSYLAGNAGPGSQANDHNLRLVTAALLTRVASADSEMSGTRREALHTILQSRFALDDHSARRLLEEAIAVNRNAIDLYRFTRELNEMLDDGGRSQLVRMMWQVVYADGHAKDFDKNIIWRAADLLGVSSRRRIELGQLVSADRAAVSQARDVLPRSPALALRR
jgi:uncharacterized tellurite resistance protein B-like protein